MRFSPLLATFCVLLGLAAFSIPLWKSTGGAERVVRPHAVATGNAGEGAIPCELRLRLIPTPLHARILHPADESILWESDTPSSDMYFTLPLAFDHGDIELLLEAEWSNDTEQSVAFLEVSPEGLPEKENHALGTHQLNAILHFHWHELHEAD